MRGGILIGPSTISRNGEQLIAVDDASSDGNLFRSRAGGGQECPSHPLLINLCLRRRETHCRSRLKQPKGNYRDASEGCQTSRQYAVGSTQYAVGRRM